MAEGATRYARATALFVWELPQNLLGAARLGLALAQRRVRRVRFENERLMIELRGGAAVSLGLFVLWTSEDNPYVPVGPENARHELGHSLQSRWLGPLYLPVVGVPSTMRVLYAVAYRTLYGKRWGGYYDGFPESWADALGGVDKGMRPPP
jgi:hypothetical protein